MSDFDINSIESIEEFNKKPKKKNKECKVIKYNALRKTLDIDFDGYGIRINNVVDKKDNIVKVEYSGEIGKPDFKFKLI